MPLNTRLTERLAIKRPVLLAPMGNVSGGALAGAVSAAGGLGLIGGGYGDADWLDGRRSGPHALPHPRGRSALPRRASRKAPTAPSRSGDNTSFVIFAARSAGQHAALMELEDRHAVGVAIDETAGAGKATPARAYFSKPFIYLNVAAIGACVFRQVCAGCLSTGLPPLFHHTAGDARASKSPLWPLPVGRRCLPVCIGSK
jgi:hypothetical protein